MDHLQPTEAMIEAGLEQLLQDIPGIEDDVDDETLRDTIVFIWQTMHGAKE